MKLHQRNIHMYEHNTQSHTRKCVEIRQWCRFVCTLYMYSFHFMLSIMLHRDGRLEGVAVEPQRAQQAVDVAHTALREPQLDLPGEVGHTHVRVRPPPRQMRTPEDPWRGATNARHERHGGNAVCPASAKRGRPPPRKHKSGGKTPTCVNIMVRIIAMACLIDMWT